MRLPCLYVSRSVLVVSGTPCLQQASTGLSMWEGCPKSKAQCATTFQTLHQRCCCPVAKASHISNVEQIWGGFQNPNQVFGTFLLDSPMPPLPTARFLLALSALCSISVQPSGFGSCPGRPGCLSLALHLLFIAYLFSLCLVTVVTSHGVDFLFQHSYSPSLSHSPISMDSLSHIMRIREQGKCQEKIISQMVLSHLPLGVGRGKVISWLHFKSHFISLFSDSLLASARTGRDSYELWCQQEERIVLHVI